MERKLVKVSEEVVLLKEQEEEFEEEEEALSLCDLPINEGKNQIKKETFGVSELVQEDFDFNSCGGNLLKESQMCTADEVFYQGQILPLRHSISLPSDTRDQRRIQNLNLISSIKRSESMGEHCRHTNSSSRSSSIRSQRSSSSGSTSSTYSKYKPKARNQFHSHPSPTPQVRFSKIAQSNGNNSSRNKSTLWSHFRVGLVTTPEIGLQDLKNRSNKDYSGSRNSTSSSSSSNGNDNRMRIIVKKKQRMFLLGSCKCSANAVETVPLNVRITTTRDRNRNSTSMITRKMTTTGVHEEHEEDNNTKATKKQTMSRHRTFEWLKQLSLEGPSDET